MKPGITNSAGGVFVTNEQTSILDKIYKVIKETLTVEESNALIGEINAKLLVEDLIDEQGNICEKDE